MVSRYNGRTFIKGFSEQNFGLKSEEETAVWRTLHKYISISAQLSWSRVKYSEYVARMGI
jgi:hypothetical protein